MKYLDISQNLSYIHLKQVDVKLEIIEADSTEWASLITLLQIHIKTLWERGHKISMNEIFGYRVSFQTGTPLKVLSASR